MRIGPFIIETTPTVLAVAVIFTLIFWAGLIFINLRHDNRARIIIRSIAHATALISLLMLLFPLHWQIQLDPKTGILITTGANPAEVARLQDALQTTQELFVLSGQKGISDQKFVTRFRDATALADAGILKRRYPEIKTLYIVGAGLKHYDLDKLHGLQLVPMLSPSAPGITFLKTPQAIQLGESLHVTGLVTGVRAPGHIYLQDATGRIDSVSFAASDSAQFTLSTKPKSAGPAQYQLLLKTKNGAMEVAESFGVHVKKPAAQNILILNSEPRSSTRFLKDWLGEKGFGVAIRTRISRARFKQEVIHLQEMDLTKLEGDLLSQFSMILCDYATAASFSAADWRLLTHAIKKSGLGLLVQLDGSPIKNLPDSILPAALKKEEERDGHLVRPVVAKPRKRLLSTIPAAPIMLQPTRDALPLVEDKSGRLLTAAHHLGQGRVGITRVNGTGRWVRRGEKNDFADFWSHVISYFLKPLPHAVQFAFAPSPPFFIDEPLKITLHSQQTKPDLFQIYYAAGQVESLSLRQDIFEPGRWHTTFWPLQTGWHTARIADGDSALFFVSGGDHFTPLQQAEMAHQTQRFALTTSGPNSGSEQHAKHASTRPIKAIWPFLSFLLSCTVLWAERKLPFYQSGR